jgi:hypothetical protein
MDKARLTDRAGQSDKGRHDILRPIQLCNSDLRVYRRTGAADRRKSVAAGATVEIEPWAKADASFTWHRP